MTVVVVVVDDVRVVVGVGVVAVVELIGLDLQRIREPPLSRNWSFLE
jgi:hypothetical protein